MYELSLEHFKILNNRVLFGYKLNSRTMKQEYKTYKSTNPDTNQKT